MHDTQSSLKARIKPWLILINDFSHDLFTGLWFGGFLTLALLREKGGQPELDGSEKALIAELGMFFLWLTLVSLMCIMVTGIVRFFYYRDWDGMPNQEVKKRLLKIKHAVLGSSILIGTVLAVFWSV